LQRVPRDSAPPVSRSITEEWKYRALELADRVLFSVSPTHRVNYITDSFLVTTLIVGGKYYSASLSPSESSWAFLISMAFIIGCFVYSEVISRNTPPS
jgi:hypothetical protein